MAILRDLTYETIDRPYDSSLERSEGGVVAGVGGGETGTEGQESISDPSDVAPKAIGGQTFEDMWITSWIKSLNYKPKQVGFLIDGRKGYIECMKLYVGSGGIEGGSLHIPDENTTANSFHVEEDADTWWGCTHDNFTADNNNATAYILKTGVAKFQSVTLSGSVAISGIANNTSTDLSLLTYTHNLIFSSSDADTVAWTSGTITFSNGRAFAIDAGNTGNMAARTYIYLDTAISSTVLQTTTTPTTAHGANKVTLTVAVNNTDTSSKAPLVVYGGAGTQVLLVDNLAANSASTNEFVANTAQVKDAIITNAKIFDLAVSKLTAGTVTSKSVVLAVSDGTGDVEIRAGIAAGDFANVGAANGFIFGIDDSDENKTKFYWGSSTSFLKFDGTIFTVSAVLIAGELHIPDENTTASSFHIETDGDTWWGCTHDNFTADNNNATAYILKTGVAKFQSVILSGSVAISGIANNTNTDLSLLTYTHDLTFSASDADTVAWTSGTVTFSNGRTFAIDAGNTGNMAARTYIYLDTAISSTVLQATTTPTTAHGPNKVTFAVAVNNSDATSKAPLVVYGGAGTQVLLVDNLAANSASTNEFVANTAQIKDAIITNAKIFDLAVSKLTAGTVTSKSIVLAVSDGTGDVEIRSGIAAGDFANVGAADGFIFGIDDSDSNKVKLFFGTPTEYIKFDGTNVTVSAPVNVDISFTAGESGSARDAVGLYGEITLAAETADADVHANIENPDTVYNTDNFVVGTRGAPNAGDEGQRPYIYWSGLGALIPTGATVISVQFSFNVAVYSASAGQVLVHICTNGPCSESTTTWNDKPNIEVASFTSFTPSATGIYTCSATPTSTQWGRIRDYGIALVENWAGGAYAYEISSRNQANPPRITIIYKVQDGSIYKVNATTAEYANSFMGFTVSDYTQGSAVVVRTEGTMSGFSGLTPYVPYYLSDTDAAIADSAGGSSKIVGRSISDTKLQIKYQIT